MVECSSSAWQLWARHWCARVPQARPRSVVSFMETVKTASSVASPSVTHTRDGCTKPASAGRAPSVNATMMRQPQNVRRTGSFACLRRLQVSRKGTGLSSRATCLLHRCPGAPFRMLREIQGTFASVTSFGKYGGDLCVTFLTGQSPCTKSIMLKCSVQ